MTVARRLVGVSGYLGRVNDILSLSSQDRQCGHVIFFGGDIQDYPENMTNQRSQQQLKWNLEKTADILSQHFPNCSVWVIKPSRMHLHTFAVYENFVESNSFGVPNHTTGQSSLIHLKELFHNAINKLGEMSNHDGNSFLPLEQSFYDSPIRLVGFSKGCVVLNQFLYDLQSVSTYGKDLTRFVANIKAMFWLDGGHCGGSNTWVIDDTVLQNFVRYNIEVYVHVTPYQVQDEMRKWIGEEKSFVTKVKELGACVTDKLHFEHEEATLENHFNVLKVFHNYTSV